MDNSKTEAKGEAAPEAKTEVKDESDDNDALTKVNPTLKVKKSLERYTKEVSTAPFIYQISSRLAASKSL